MALKKSFSHITLPFTQAGYTGPYAVIKKIEKTVAN